jgi:hypothetical protein
MIVPNYQRRFVLTCAVLLTGLVVALGFRALFLGETFVARDLTDYYRPAKAIVAPLTQAWQGVPLWNPFFASGQPFAANPEHEIFHPLSVLLLLLPFEWVFRLQVLLPLVFGALSMLALLRGLGRSRYAALFGGMAWGFGGYLLSTTNLLPILFAASALPLVLLFAVRACADRRPEQVAGLAAVFGLVCLAGEPSTLLATPALLAGLLASRRPRPGLRACARLAGGLALGAALGAAALLPGMHHASKTVRAGGIGVEAANDWSMPAVRAAELITPNVIGHIDHADEPHYWGWRLYHRHAPFLYSLYPGLLTTALALAALTARRRLWPWLGVAVAGFLVALGSHFPIWGLLRRLPMLSGIRFPEKFALLIALPVVVASAYGFDQLIHASPRGRGAPSPRERGAPSSRRRGASLLLAVAAAGVAIGGALAIHTPPPPWRSLALADAARLTAAGLIGFALMHLPASMTRVNRALVLCVVLAVDLASAGHPLLPTAPVASVATPPRELRPILADAEKHLLFHLADWDSHRWPATGTAGPPVPAQWGLATTLERDFDLTQLRWSHRAAQAFFAALGREGTLLGPLLRRRGVTDLLRFRPGAHWEGNRLIPGPGETSALALLEARDPQPFAFAASRVVMVRGEEGWVAAVRRLGEEAFHTACLDESELAAFPGLPSPAVVSIADRGVAGAHLLVDSRGPAPSFVAINQTWDEGWRATIDGVGARLLRTDIDLSGLVVPPGRHDVRLSYHDPWVSAGLLVSLLAGLGCLGLVLWGRRRALAGTTTPAGPPGLP